GPLLPRTIDEDAAHRLRRGGEEVPRAVPALLSTRGRLPAPSEPHIRLMNQRRRLERLPRLLLSEFMSRQPAQLVIDQRQELLGGRGVALLDGRQDAAGFSCWQHDVENLPSRTTAGLLPTGC